MIDVDGQIGYLTQFYTIRQIDRYCNGSADRLTELYDDTQPIEVNIEELSDVNTGSYYLCDSPDGWVTIEQWRNKGVKPVIKVITENHEIIASEDHCFQTSDGVWLYARDIRVGDLLLTVDGVSSVTGIFNVGVQVVYDLAIGHENHRYFTNGISSHNSGKSLVLQNLALNWVFAGYLVIYFTLELSEELVSFRLDSMISGKSTTDVIRNISDVALMVEMKKARKRLYIKKMPEGSTTTNDLRAFLKEFEIQTGKRPDAIIVDYLDLMYPNNNRIDPSELFVKDKYVSEELRGLMDETNTFGASAAQLNRGALEAQGEFDHSHIGGGISKIQTADNVIAIMPPMRGEYSMMFLKTRSSACVNQRIKLNYNSDCMRITDPDAADTDKVQSYEDIRTELHEQAKKAEQADESVPCDKPSLRNLMAQAHRRY